MHNIIEARQKNEVEGIVLQRVGRECCRIFRLLAIKGQLEQKQIGGKAMAPKNVKALLYRLLKEQMLCPLIIRELFKSLSIDLHICHGVGATSERKTEHHKKTVLADEAGIAKTSEHEARQSIFLWKVDYRVVLHKILDDSYHAATNLCLRHAHEIRKEQEVMGLVDQLDATKDAGSNAHVPQVTLASVQREQVKRISRITKILDVSLLKLDDAILLFHDF